MIKAWHFSKPMAIFVSRPSHSHVDFLLLAAQPMQLWLQSTVGAMLLDLIAFIYCLELPGATFAVKHRNDQSISCTYVPFLELAKLSVVAALHQPGTAMLNVLEGMNTRCENRCNEEKEVDFRFDS